MTGKTVPFTDRGHTIPPVISGMLTGERSGIVIIGKVENCI